MKSYFNYDPPCVGSIKSIDDFCQSVPAALQYWLDLHLNREAWAQNWTMDEDIQWAFENCAKDGILQNDYFWFDWKAAASKAQAEEELWAWEICPECGSIAHQDWSEEFCENCEYNGEEIERVELTDVERLVEFYEDCGTELSEQALAESLKTDGFDAYRQGVASATASVEDEIAECLEAIAAAEDNYSLLQAVMWATRVYHVNGNIMEDYADSIGLDSQLISDIRDNGLESYFDRDEIREFLET